jgi:hypothetical protein
MATKKKPTAAPLAGTRPNFSCFNEDQWEAYRLATTPGHRFLLFYGSAGSGKSWLIMFMVLLRALAAPNTRHAAFRLTRNSCEQTLFLKTLFEVLDTGFPGLRQQIEARKGISYSDMTLTLPNGSQVFFNGLDENRLTKVLGDEFNTVWLNECNEDGLNYRTVSVLINRLRKKSTTLDGATLKNKIFFDCNPRWFSDWEYKAFRLHINPNDGDAMPRPEQWVSCKLRTAANLDNLIDDYLENMETMSAAERRRYLEGEWSDENTNALFTEKLIVQGRLPKPQAIITPAETLAYLKDQGVRLHRVTIAADPAVTADPKSDLTGITVQGIARTDEGQEHAYVLADYSDRYTPDNACRVIAQAYRDWGASRVIMEKNQGGLWLEATLRKHFDHVPLKWATANATTGGKASRAEPVAAQYERGVVHHVGKFKELEEQMCDFGSPASRRKSPDRMDALVWGLSELFDLGAEKTRTPGYTAVTVRRHR